MKVDSCGDCVFLKTEKTYEGQYANSGRCRRYPPQNMARLREADDFNFPKVSITSWCGEWKLQEAKWKNN